MAAVYTMHVDAGSNFERHFYYTDDNDGVMDLTGWVATMQIRETPDADLTLEVTPTIDVELGKISVSMSPVETGGLILPNYVYQIELAKAGEVVRILQGKVVISPEVVVGA